MIQYETIDGQHPRLSRRYSSEHGSDGYTTFPKISRIKSADSGKIPEIESGDLEDSKVDASDTDDFIMIKSSYDHT